MERWEYCFVPKITSGAHGTRDATLVVEMNKLAALGWRVVNIRDSGAYMERRAAKKELNAIYGKLAASEHIDNTG